MAKTEQSQKAQKSLQERCKTLLKIWSESENGAGQYKFTGGYWEVLYPILKKYAPGELKSYENQLGEDFDYFDPRVKRICDAGDEESNFRNSVNYMNERIEGMTAPDTIHHIDIDNDETIAYLPNQSIDQTHYWGREDNSDLFK